MKITCSCLIKLLPFHHSCHLLLRMNARCTTTQVKESTFIHEWFNTWRAENLLLSSTTSIRFIRSYNDKPESWENVKQNTTLVFITALAYRYHATEKQVNNVTLVIILLLYSLATPPNKLLGRAVNYTGGEGVDIASRESSTLYNVNQVCNKLNVMVLTKWEPERYLVNCCLDFFTMICSKLTKKCNLANKETLSLASFPSMFPTIVKTQRFCQKVQNNTHTKHSIPIAILK